MTQHRAVTHWPRRPAAPAMMHHHPGGSL